ncbi:MCP four helix bundle domain-containing protein, partial [Herbaspirillum sp. B65]|uniref:MCP four helix bundle domain-containing protein n=1 Tax=Herbaspirillum sp. B65 TaxID=137708 RepID=UPI0005C90A08
MRFNNFSIATRLAIAFSVLILAIATIVTLGLIRLGDINEAINLVVNDRYKKIALINTIAGKMDDVAISVRNQLLTSDSGQAAREQANSKELASQVTAHFQELETSLVDPAARAQFAKVMSAREQYTSCARR